MNRLTTFTNDPNTSSTSIGTQKIREPLNIILTCLLFSLSSLTRPSIQRLVSRKDCL